MNFIEFQKNHILKDKVMKMLVGLNGNKSKF